MTSMESPQRRRSLPEGTDEGPMTGPQIFRPRTATPLCYPPENYKLLAANDELEVQIQREPVSSGDLVK